jgi:ubiquinone/menaquinone biosynthesis C-methylase UbiE
MAEHKNVYINETGRYHALVSFEDYEKNLPAILHHLIGEGCPSVLESGAGTGRVTEILAPVCREVIAFDLSPSMLVTANKNTRTYPKSLTGFASADHRLLPVNDQRFDRVVSGWSVCYLVSWNAKNWKTEVNRAFSEFCRVLNPDGKIVLIETLGTGKTSPAPPNKLVDYLSYLDSLGYKREVIRTDYQFPDKQTAENLVDFFFGKEMVPAINMQTRPILPECSGLWIISRSELVTKIPGQNRQS